MMLRGCTKGTSICGALAVLQHSGTGAFLKSAATELAHLIKVFKQYGLCYPETA